VLNTATIPFRAEDMRLERFIEGEVGAGKRTAMLKPQARADPST